MSLRKIGFSNILFGAILGYLVFTRAPAIYKQFQLQGQAAPTVLVENMDGTQLQLPISNKKHLLVFWATWCGPCKVELARINKLVRDNKIPKDSVVAISIGEARDVVQKQIQESEYLFTVALDQEGRSSELYNVIGTPTMVLVSEFGNQEWVSTGISPSLEIRLVNYLSASN